MPVTSGKVTLGLGSNEGNRLSHLEAACRALSKLPIRKRGGIFRVSPIYETPALLPERAPDHWNKPFLNLVLETEFDSTPQETLQALQAIELDQGRGAHEKWSPRLIDIDILLWGDQTFSSPDLSIPHPRMSERAFILDPLKDLNPTQENLKLARAHPQHSPLWMGVLNITPDSFSNEGLLGTRASYLESIIQSWDDSFIGIIDIGGESTRPGATPLTSTEEWLRIEPALSFLNQRYQGKIIRPQISLDTRHPENALKALQLGWVNIINDVSGLADPLMLELLADLPDTQYVLMHSLSVPADPTRTLTERCDPVSELLNWFEGKLSQLEKAGVRSTNIILDPGIGFGKTALQSLELLRNIDRFTRLPYRVLVGHSRKSFLTPWTKYPAQDRDLESIGVSLNLAPQGVDILRVHEPTQHIRAFRAGNHIRKNTPQKEFS